MNITRLLAGSLTLLLGAGTAAQAKPPTLERFFPPGAQRGRTTTVTAVGSFDHWPPQTWCSAPGVEIKPGKEKRELSITIADDAKPGIHWVRFSDDEGATVLRPFVVGVLPEVVETESEDRAIALESSQITINGRLGRRNDVDEYSVPLKKGQTLVAAVDANQALGSPMDAVIQVASTNGFVLAQNDDDRGFDPKLSFEVPEDGSYLVRIFAFPATPDSTIGFAGGDNYVYRLTLTTGGYLDHGYPLAVERSKPGEVEAHGWNVPEGGRRLQVVAGPHTGPDSVSLAHPEFANTVDVQLVAHPALTEDETADLATPQPIPVPGTLTGRIAPARDQDVYSFAAKKGQSLMIAVAARTLGAPLDPVLRISDEAGKVLNDVDDNDRNKGRDIQQSFTPPADGTYRLSIKDLHGDGGERYVYRLTIAVPEPEFALTLKSDRLALTPEKAEKLEVTIDRKNGHKLPIEVQLAGLPDGLTCEPIVSEVGKPTEKVVTFSLTAPLSATHSGSFQVIGKATVGDQTTERAARSPIEGFSEATTDRPWVTILKPAASKSP